MASFSTLEPFLQPDDVNASQWRAIMHEGSHLLIIAGPGTGKTHTLIYRIARCMQCLEKSSCILALTFTNKAAEAMRQRLKNLLGCPDGRVVIGTFHQVFLQMLRTHQEKAGLPEDFRVASNREIAMAVKEAFPGKTAKECREIKEQISWQKSVAFRNPRRDILRDYDRILRGQGLADFDDLLLNAYQLLETQRGILQEERTRYPFIFVDEFQDVNAVQHALLQLLASRKNLLTAIGDPHQAIYGFRGADVRFFIDFQKDFPESAVLSLADNYRCAQNILSASDQVITKIRNKNIPPLTAKIYQQGKLSIYQAPTDKAEAEYVVHQIEKMVGGVSLFSRDSKRVGHEDAGDKGFGDIAVLYRLNNQRLVLMEAFERMGIPYQLSGDKPLMDKPGVLEIMTLCRLVWGLPGSPVLVCRLLEAVVDSFSGRQGVRVRDFWGSKDVSLEDIESLLENETLFDDAAVYMQLTQCIRDIHALRFLCQSGGYREAVVALPEFAIGKQIFRVHQSVKEDWQRLDSLSRAFDGPAAFYDHLALLRSDDVPRQAEKVSLMTMHAAKGLEYAAVFIVGCEQHIIPLQLEGHLCDKEEERRLFYVAMTRAKERLYLTSARKRFLYGQKRLHNPSEFIDDITEDLKNFEQQGYKRRQHRQDDRQVSFF